MLEFVEKLTLCPWLLGEADIAGLRSEGFPDSAILHIVLGCAHFNYLNRMADGIGIRFEYATGLPDVAYGHVPPASPPSRAGARHTQLRSGSSACAWIALPEANEPDAPAECGQPSHLYRAMSANPEARDLAREWRRYQLTGTRALETRLRYQLSLYISGLNYCSYSDYWLKKELERLGEAQSDCERLASGELPQNLDAGSQEHVLFEHARRLTTQAATTGEEHIDQLRRVGLDDHGILQLTMLCSYFSFENRVALALGIPVETGPLG